MKTPYLPPILASAPCRVNPVHAGVTDIACQTFPPVHPKDDQTQIPGSMASAALINSNGDPQRPASMDAVGSNGVSVSASSAPVAILSGETYQQLNLKAPDVAIVTGIGLAAEEKPDSVSHVRASLPMVATSIPPSITTNAGTPKANGLPANILIR